MKTKVKFFFWVLTLGMFFAACDKGNDGETVADIDTTITEAPVVDTVEMGTVLLKPLVKDIIQVKTGKPPTLDEVLDDMTVIIRNLSGALIIDADYRDLPEFIELAPSSYTLIMLSEHNSSDFRWDMAAYGSQHLSFDVVSGKNTNLNAVLTLLDVAVSVTIAEELKLSYSDFSVVANLNSAEFVASNNPSFEWNTLSNDGRTGYVHWSEYSGTDGPFSISGEMIIEVRGTNSSGVYLEVSKTYTNLNSNEHYNIRVESGADSSIGLNITLEDEDVINDTITFPN